MPVPQKIDNRIHALIDEVNASQMEPGEKDLCREILIEAHDGTNGLDVEAKTQANSCNIANLTYLLVRDMLKRAGASSSWKDVVVKCSWQITIVLVALFALIALHPELGGVLAQLKN